ncbi:hypothetical protein KAFR_0D03110 [Kazachstania africana CBS 2517]|uniref:Apurinic-apyrimidinic endonuclease 1 n=1 Tax=Kazachstania africana (strain ATCC 22294 / BCRC 22015 / CBS 2517 / CECT 1963 / NBRC 1671 / NRRL Y-8276) TaxID=1071382 RepID=H2AUA9_KAZAF|nr:hypothetical protein KAFR_0D03110 [Kazachstania africana CBS 2517]CCF57959.1 hypothetical protein KAFR_0D03110 [Kazachstania africana CBS 2517]
MSNFIRSTKSNFKFGAHVTIKGGISNSVTNAHNIGCNAFALFLKSPKKWLSPQYTNEEISKFKENCIKFNYNPLTDILPHGQYFINLCNPDPEKVTKSYESFIDELNRCESLGIGLYNLHPGSAINGDFETQLKQLATHINNAINETKFVKIVLENMAGNGNLIGAKLSDFKTIINEIEPKNRNRIGICIDTCHTFVAGFNLLDEDSFTQFWKDFDEIIGLKYLSAIHLNDSKAPTLSNKDLHEKIGQGFLTLNFFHNLVTSNLDFLKNIPIVLETPITNNIKFEEYGEEIKMLEWLEELGPDVKDNQEFLDKFEALQKLGESSRKEQLQKFQTKQSKTTKKRKATNGSIDITKQLSKKSKTVK